MTDGRGFALCDEISNLRHCSVRSEGVEGEGISLGLVTPAIHKSFLRF